MAVLLGICLLVILGVCGQPFVLAQTQYEIRLMREDTVTMTNEGRVEIYYNGEWGTLCGHTFYVDAARVVCRQLGFSISSLSYYRSSIQYGEGAGPVWLRVYDCTGNEELIHECKNPNYNWGVTSCSSSYSHVGVRCSYTSLSLHQTIRLSGLGSTPSRGRVEINYYGRWGTVCRDLWDSLDADVVCKQLGFSGSSETSISLNGTASGIIWLDNVQCNANDDLLGLCFHATWGSHNCDHSEDIALACSVTSDLDDYTLRLAGTNAWSNEGRLEIYYSGQWGSVCDTYFNGVAASRACTQLGFNSAVTYRSNAFYGGGSGSVWYQLPTYCNTGDSLESCPHYDPTSTTCSHLDDVGIVCSRYSSTYQYSIRLVGRGSSTSEGRVEIIYAGRWGTVCGDFWDNLDAEVVCKQLGFTGPATANVGQYGSGSGMIWLDNVHCDADDDVLAECSHSQWGSHNCDHSQDAGVVCTASTNETEEIQIRLVTTTSNPDEGRLELFVNGLWGTVCDNYFYSAEGNIACRQLGYSSVARYRSNGYYGAGLGPVWLQLSSSTGCIGDEETIVDCPHLDFVSTTCSHTEDIGVVCNRHSLSIQYSIRLAGHGSSASEGRVEINYAGRWGTVCGDSWGNINAGVVCKQLGFTGSSIANVGQYGAGSGIIWLDDVHCDESDDTLASCSHSSWGTSNCEHSQDAGVVCSSTDEIGEMAIRLIGSDSSILAGRVEIFHDGQWGTVCGISFDKNDADVICRQLGFNGSTSFGADSFYGAGSGAVWLENPGCTGNEERLAECNLPAFGTVRTSCDHGNDVSLRCSIDPGMLREFAVRLVGSSNSEGRIEINYNGQWGTICDAGWGPDDASVACRQLGFTGAARAISGSQYGKGTGRIWIKELACRGDEIYLASCTNDGWGNTEGCAHNNDAGVVCITDREHDDFVVRLAGAGSLSHAGRVEMYYNNQWGTICDNSWDMEDATVVCRQLGFASATDAPRGSFYGRGSGPIWIGDVTCSGTETSLEMCGHIVFGNTGCDHSHEASVICSTDRNEQDFTVRLAGTDSSASEGRVEISYSGQWGTVCSDRWGIDDATVVCKQLGFAGAMDVGDATTYGEGTGPIWLDNVDCSGSEETLNECRHDGWGTSDCEHSHDAGVVCSTPARGYTLTAGGIAGISVCFVILIVVVVLLLIVNCKQRQTIIKTREEAPVEISMPKQTVVDDHSDAYENLAIS